MTLSSSIKSNLLQCQTKSHYVCEIKLETNLAMYLNKMNNEDEISLK